MSASTGTTAGRVRCKWRKKKLDENAVEFRAKEALRLRNYRARKKEARQYQRSCVRTRTEEDSRVHQDENELSDDVEAWLYDAVEGHCRTSHSERPSHFSSTRTTPPSQSSSGSKNLHMATFRDAHELPVDRRELMDVAQKGKEALLEIDALSIQIDELRDLLTKTIRAVGGWLSDRRPQELMDRQTGSTCNFR